MTDLQVNGSYDIAAGLLKNLEWLDYHDSAERIYNRDSISGHLLSRKDEHGVIEDFAVAQDVHDYATADDADTQAIFDFYYKQLEFRLELTKQFSPEHDYSYEFCRGDYYTSTFLHTSVCPVKDTFYAVSGYRRNSNGVTKYRLPPLALYYTMIGVLYDNSNIAGFRLYDWVTDTAADYSFESVKKRLIEGSVRITNIEAIGRGTNKEVVCTQGKFEYYTSLTKDGQPIGLYRPLVYLTGLSSINGGGFFIDYLGRASYLSFSFGLLSVGVANLVITYKNPDNVAYKPTRDAMPFGAFLLKPGEDYVGHVKIGNGGLQFFPNDSYFFGCYRAYVGLSFQNGEWTSSVCNSRYSNELNRYHFEGYGFGLYNGKFAQYIVPVQSHQYLNLVWQNPLSPDYYVQLFDMRSPAHNLALCYPVYPAIDTEDSRSNRGSHLTTTEGTIIKTSDLGFQKWAWLHNRTEFPRDEVIQHNNKEFAALRDMTAWVAPRGYYELPMCMLKLIEMITKLRTYVTMLGDSEEKRRSVALQVNSSAASLAISYDAPILLNGIDMPVSLDLQAANQLKIDGAISDIRFSGVHTLSNLVLNELSKVPVLNINRASRACNVQNLTINGDFVTLSAAAFSTSSRTGITLYNVCLPDTIEIIDTGAFSNQSKLASINIPKSLKILGSNAFFMCEKLTNVTLPEGLRVIGSRAFAGCENLGTIVIPSTVTFIGAGAFLDCNLQNVIFKGDISKIDIAEGAFEGNSSTVERLLEPHEGTALKTFKGDLFVDRTAKGVKLMPLTATTMEKADNMVYSKHIADLYPGFRFIDLYLKNQKKGDLASDSTQTVDE